MPITPRTIDPAVLYRTSEAAALVGRPSAEAFAKAMQRKGIAPVVADAKPQLWSGADLREFLGVNVVPLTAKERKAIAASATRRVFETQYGARAGAMMRKRARAKDGADRTTR